MGDLGMLLWLYPSLGGMEYVLHRSLAGIAVAYSMFSGEGQLYTYMILISEITTPEINMRWYRNEFCTILVLIRGSCGWWYGTLDTPRIKYRFVGEQQAA